MSFRSIVETDFRKGGLPFSVQKAERCVVDLLCWELRVVAELRTLVSPFGLCLHAQTDTTVMKRHRSGLPVQLQTRIDFPPARILPKQKIVLCRSTVLVGPAAAGGDHLTTCWASGQAWNYGVDTQQGTESAGVRISGQDVVL